LARVSGTLAAEFDSLVWGHYSIFQRISRLGRWPILQRRRSTEANQTLHDVWPSGLVHYTVSQKNKLL